MVRAAYRWLEILSIPSARLTTVCSERSRNDVDILSVTAPARRWYRAFWMRVTIKLYSFDLLIELTGLPFVVQLLELLYSSLLILSQIALLKLFYWFGISDESLDGLQKTFSRSASAFAYLRGWNTEFKYGNPISFMTISIKWAC